MKRGESGLSLLVAVNKPTGMSSHDVVNRCRRIFGERRVGHTGTLDPLATGVLPICVGPATRLDTFLTGHDKSYRVTIAFGSATTTDDTAGEVIERGSVPAHLFDEEFARYYLEGLVGGHDQLPPRYSAIKVNGERSYDAARKGREVELTSRPIRIYEAGLVDILENENGTSLLWIVDFAVSKGTYIRSIARDIGQALSCPAHVHALARTRSGLIGLEDCVSLELLESLGVQAAIDPVRALGLRFAFADDIERFVQSGTALYRDQLELYDPVSMNDDQSTCACTTGICKSSEPPLDGEVACALVANRLKALYRFDSSSDKWRAACVFSTPIARL